MIDTKKFSITPLSSAGIMLSYKCNSQCKHCLYNCSSEWSEWITEERLHSIYYGTVKCVKYPHGFHIAGGEAFINYPLLLKAVKLAKEYGIHLDYVETNAGWFVDEKSAVDKLQELKDAGLDCLLVSASPFHSEYIPIEKTIGAIHASMKVFGTIVWLPEFLQELSSIRTSGTITFDEYVKKYGEHSAKSAAVYGGQLIPGGRSAFKLGEYMTLRPKEDYLSGNCEYELLKSARGHFDPYGNIITGVCTGISVGNCDDLYDAYTSFNMEDYPVIKALAEKGVKGLYELAVEEYAFKAKEEYAGKCHLCMDIRRHLVSCEAPYSELTPKEFYSRI